MRLNHYFSGPGWLAGGGEMSALMRAKDWSASPLGSSELLPLFLDGRKHPSALGQAGREVSICVSPLIRRLQCDTQCSSSSSSHRPPFWSEQPLPTPLVAAAREQSRKRARTWARVARCLMAPVEAFLDAPQTSVFPAVMGIASAGGQRLGGKCRRGIPPHLRTC